MYPCILSSYTRHSNAQQEPNPYSYHGCYLVFAFGLISNWSRSRIRPNFNFLPVPLIFVYYILYLYKTIDMTPVITVSLVSQLLFALYNQKFCVKFGNPRNPRFVASGVWVATLTGEAAN